MTKCRCGLGVKSLLTGICLAGWAEASVSFIQSGGYSISDRIKDVSCRTLILWGRSDEILDLAFAQRFADEIPDSELVYMEECGHCGHLEKPERIAQELLRFVGIQSPTDSQQLLSDAAR